jgi:hypothetical protein
MQKYLYFNTLAVEGTAADEETACFMASTLLHMEMHSTTEIKLQFAVNPEGNAGDDAVVILNCTAGKEKDIMDTLINEINYGQDAMLVVADDANSVYLHADVTSVGTISVVDAS